MFPGALRHALGPLGAVPVVREGFLEQGLGCRWSEWTQSMQWDSLSKDRKQQNQKVPELEGSSEHSPVYSSEENSNLPKF